MALIIPVPPKMQNLILSKCDTFVDFQLWPAGHELNPRSWLENFTPAEKPYALTLLNSFLYYPNSLTAKLLRHSFLDLSRRFSAPNRTFREVKHDWTRFLDMMLLCTVTGETPNPTDSAFFMVRLARQHLGLDQGTIFEPSALISRLVSTRNQHVVFVDDFVGSGNQFIQTWERLYRISTNNISFQILAQAGLGHTFYYLPIVATHKGVERISNEAPNVILRPCHILGPEYNSLDPLCPFWPDDQKANAYEVIRNASDRAGIPADEWKGFHELGLAFAFEHSTPDATLPIFYWQANDWKYLIKRS